MEVIDGNDGALAAGIAVAATMQLFALQRPSHLIDSTNRACHIDLNSSPRENTHLTIRYTKARRAPRIDSTSRLHAGLPPTKLLLRLTEQLLAQQIFPVETTFPSHALSVVQVGNVPESHVTNCTVVLLIVQYIVLYSSFCFCAV